MREKRRLARIWHGTTSGRSRSIIRLTNGANTNESAREVVLEFSVEETRVDLPGDAGRQPQGRLPADVPGTGDRRLDGLRPSLLDMMGHGRDEDAFDDADLSGRVGFFISYTPMVLTVQGNGANSGPALLTDQIQPILGRGLDLRPAPLHDQRCDDPADVQRPAASPDPVQPPGKREMSSTRCPADRASRWPQNRWATPTARAASAITRWRSPPRSGGISCVLNFVYSENLHNRSTVERLADEFRRHLLASGARFRGS